MHRSTSSRPARRSRSTPARSSAATDVGYAKGAFLANIERNAGFDDDGKVRITSHATAGAASDEHDMTWTTVGNPLNPRATDPLVVELSADQESSTLPKARAGNTAIDAIPGDGSGQIVDYDVNTWDQFGNRTQQNTDETDNTPLAGFVSSGTVGLRPEPAVDLGVRWLGDEPVDRGRARGPVTTTYDSNPGDSSFDITNPLAFIQSQPGRGRGQHRHRELVRRGLQRHRRSRWASRVRRRFRSQSLVTEVVAATDQEGQPIENMVVDFLRGGPSNEDDDTCNEDLLANCQRTDGNGQAFYDFVGGSAGTASVTAVMYSAEGMRIRHRWS